MALNGTWTYSQSQIYDEYDGWDTHVYDDYKTCNIDNGIVKLEENWLLYTRFLYYYDGEFYLCGNNHIETPDDMLDYKKIYNFTGMGDDTLGLYSEYFSNLIIINNYVREK